MKLFFLLSASVFSLGISTDYVSAKPMVFAPHVNGGDQAFHNVSYNAQATQDLIAFTQAKKTDDVAGLKKLLDQGANINARNAYGATALAMAADNNHVDAVKLLVARGADVNKTENRGVTPLFMASLKGYGEIVDILLSAKADPDIKDARRGFAAISVAAQFGYEGIVKSLIKAGADVNTQSNTGKTPIYMAVQKKGNFKVVSLLLGAKADLLLGEKTDNGVRTPVMEAYKTGDTYIINAVVAAMPQCIKTQKVGDWDVLTRPTGYVLTPKLTKVKNTNKSQSVTFSKYKDKISFDYSHSITGHVGTDSYKIYVDNQMVLEVVYDVEYENNEKVSETLPIIPPEIMEKIASGQNARVQHIRFAQTDRIEKDAAYFSLNGLKKAIEFAEKEAVAAAKDKAAGRCAIINLFGQH